MNFDLLKARLLAAAPNGRDLVLGVVNLLERQAGQIEEAERRLREVAGDLDSRARETDDDREPTSDAAWASDQALKVSRLLYEIEGNTIQFDTLDASAEAVLGETQENTWLAWAEAFAIFAKYPGHEIQPGLVVEGVCCEHDKIWAGPSEDVVGEVDKQRLSELKWVPADEGGFSRFT